MIALSQPTKTPRFQFAEEDKKQPRKATAGTPVTPLELSTQTTGTLLVGFDWGTNKSCLQAGMSASTELPVLHTVPTVVGYAQEGIVDGLLPGDAKVLFGQEALKHRLHLNLCQPMVDGIIKDLDGSRDFARHIRSLLNVAPGVEVRAVIGIPANADPGARENMRQAVKGVFDRVILIPEPFLASLGYRDETRLTDPTYLDPVKNSLFIDIGGGTTDVCLIQGYFPTAQDQISFAFAGDKVDALLNEGLLRTYPDCTLTSHAVRDLKEKHSYVGKAESPIIATVMSGGKVRKLDVTDQVGTACTALLDRIYEAVQSLIARSSSDSVSELLQSIVLTGGGSRIRNLDVELQRRLSAEGYEQPKVHVVGPNYKEFVARGAFKAARQARDNQWQQLMA